VLDALNSHVRTPQLDHRVRQPRHQADSHNLKSLRFHPPTYPDRLPRYHHVER
jgi:hypothetical protein